MRLGINYAMFERTGYKKVKENQCKFCFKQYDDNFQGNQCTLCFRPFYTSNNEVKKEETKWNKRDRKKEALALKKAKIKEAKKKERDKKKEAFNVIKQSDNVVKKSKEKKQKIETHAGLDLSGKAKPSILLQDFIPFDTKPQKFMTKNKSKGNKKAIKSALWREKQAQSISGGKLNKFLKWMK